MKRALVLLFLLSVGFLSVASAAPKRMTYDDAPMGSSTVAPDRVGHWDFGMFFGGAFNSDSDDVGFFGGQLAYGVTPWIALGVEAGWQEGQVSADNDQDLGMVPILCDITIRFPNVHQSLVPYGVVGLGVIGTYLTDENGQGASDGRDSDDTAFGWKIGAGVDWFLNERWIMNFEFAYYDSDPSLVNNAAVSDFDFWSLVAGVKYVY